MEALENKIQQIEPIQPNYENFVNIVKKISRKHILGGYVPGLDKPSARFSKNINMNLVEIFSLLIQYYLDRI